MAANDEMRDEKRALREAMRARRLLVSAAEATAAGERAAALLDAYLVTRTVATALLYAPLAGEVDTAPIDRMLRARGGLVAYPRAGDGGELHLHFARPGELQPGRFAIREPNASAPPLDPARLDLVLVPGLAFDRFGHRLGFGRGYYDTLLARAPRALRIGAAFDWQLQPRVPVEPHDQRLDLVIAGEVLVTGARAIKETSP